VGQADALERKSAPAMAELAGLDALVRKVTAFRFVPELP